MITTGIVTTGIAIIILTCILNNHYNCKVLKLNTIHMTFLGIFYADIIYSDYKKAYSFQ